MLSLRSAMPITTSSLSTCSGSGPLGSTRITSFAVVTARLSGIPGSRPSSHLMRSTLDGSDMGGGPRRTENGTAPWILYSTVVMTRVLDMTNFTNSGEVGIHNGNIRRKRYRHSSQSAVCK
jgi:hypothetical protein